ncbi:MAG: type II toxin-antitoxin system VapC family toxin [Acidobacteriaceae bacterium]|nr:type II toxin-antitoxin system VapC family toxin [Acidobacteriaceae bacterium]MBV9225883.1 type II toxin-antitoxin system VapC family toxin [Acidobacteriaceae bacterium]MBV9305070.1 type II toxin-antitoxin system VapC family toxin [Acidobacteriaceae bacterium]MBV9679476.1 type II toxin-antitoxin system VapC family toxin [Acidobacteriaceae bacterium]
MIISFLSPDELPKKARSIMEDSSVERILSVISIVEVGIKSGLGKLKITEAELHMAIRDLQLKVIPFSAMHAFGLFRLPQRTDMFDRMLVATALALDMPIIGGDREFSQYEGLKVVWQ